MTNHAVFQILSTTPQGVEAGSGWFSKEANELARQKFPETSRDAVYGITNAHVVHGSVALYSRHSVARKSDLPIQVVGICQEADLALVKISGDAKHYLEQKLKEKAGISSIPMLELANSDSCMPANYNQTDPNHAVLAVGYPLGCEFQSTTTGVVENWKRIPGHSESLFLAHTATIQPGNSGGALLLGGKVVGVNSLKASSQNVDNLNMSIPSNTVANYLPHLLNESQTDLTRAVIQLANRLNAQGLEMALLEAATKDASFLGDPASMETAYNEAMMGESVISQAMIPMKHRTLSAFVRRYAREPGFHSLWSRVSCMIHTGDHAALRTMAAGDTFKELLCKPCKVSRKCDDCERKKKDGEELMCGYTDCNNMYTACQSAIPAKVVHSVNMGFDYKPMTRTTAQALGVAAAETGGVIVTSALEYGPTAALQRYDVITAVKTSNDGLCRLDENGEHYKASWGLSLSLSDLVERAQLGTEVAFQVHRGQQNLVMKWNKVQQNKPSCRVLDASEQHLNSCVTIGGCSFKVLRMNDMMDPGMVNTRAAKYAMDPHKRHLETVIVSDVSPASVAYHNYSLRPGMVLDEINRTSLKECESPWVAFCQMLVDSAKTGVALLATEKGGIDSIRVSPQEAASLTQYLQQII